MTTMRNDDAMFETLLTPVLPAAYRAAFHFTRNAADAEDAVQQAALLALRAIGTFQEGTNFRAWFLRIVTNVCHSEYRRARRTPISVSVDEPELGEGIIPAEVAMERSEPIADISLIGRLEVAQIEEALARLPEEYRTVAQLYFAEDLSYQEIAEIVGCPVGTVRSRLHRGRKILQQDLADLGADRGFTAAARLVA